MDRKPSICVFLYSNMCPAELGALLAFFVKAKKILPVEHCNFFTAGLRGEELKIYNSLYVERDCDIDDIDVIDILFLPGWDSTDGEVIQTRVLNEIIRLYNAGAKIVALSSAKVYVEASKLNGDPWDNKHHISTRKNINNTYQIKYSNPYGQRTYVTTDRVNSFRFLQELLLKLTDETVFLDLAKSFGKSSYLIHGTGGADTCYAEREVEYQGIENRIVKVLIWATENIGVVCSVDDLAKESCLSRRSFDRHFSRMFHTTPKVWLDKNRISMAQSLLTLTDLSLDQISAIVGYRGKLNFRNNFLKYLNRTPYQYRCSAILAGQTESRFFLHEGIKEKPRKALAGGV